jgi:hypothetical protein
MQCPNCEQSCEKRSNLTLTGKTALGVIYNEINRAISSFGARICNERESDKECPITRAEGKSGTPRHARHVSPIIYESITYLPNF